jgi:hypothetical protein
MALGFLGPARARQFLGVDHRRCKRRFREGLSMMEASIVGRSASDARSVLNVRPGRRLGVWPRRVARLATGSILTVRRVPVNPFARRAAVWETHLSFGE